MIKAIPITFFMVAGVLFGGGLLCSFFSVPVRAAPDISSLTLAYTEFRPFHYTDEGGRLRGLFVDIINEALANRMEIDVNWEEYPWERCQNYVETGRVDAIMTVPTVPRAAYSSTHPTPFYRKVMHLYTYAGHPRLEQIRSIDGIGMIEALGLSVITYSGNGWHQHHIAGRGISSHETGSLASVWKMLAGRRGDLVIEWPGAALPDLRRLELEDQVTDTGIELDSMDFHLLVGKRSGKAELLPDFEAVIKEMRQHGVIRLIEARHRQEEAL